MFRPNTKPRKRCYDGFNGGRNPSMQLYSGMSEHFLSDVVQNRIAEKLKDSFFRHFRFNPSPSEVNSWRNSLSAMAHVMRHAALTDHGVFLEYQLPLTSKRLDCIICGK